MPDDHNECHLHSQQEAWHHIVIDMSMAHKGLNCVDIHFKFGCVSKHIGRCIYIYVDITHDNDIRTLTLIIHVYIIHKYNIISLENIKHFYY